MHVKAGDGIILGEKVSHEWAKDPETVPAPTVRDPTRKTIYSAVVYVWRTKVRCLQAP